MGMLTTPALPVILEDIMLIRTPEQDIERILYTEKAIAARVEQLGAELTAKLGDKRPVLVCVLKGASFF